MNNGGGISVHRSRDYETSIQISAGASVEKIPETSKEEPYKRFAKKKNSIFSKAQGVYNLDNSLSPKSLYKV